MDVDGLLKDLLQHLLVDQEIHFQGQFVARDGAVHEAEVLIKDLVEEEAAERAVNVLTDRISVPVHAVAADRHERVQVQSAVFIGQDGFVHAAEGRAFTLRAGTDLGQVVDAQDHVLRRHRHGTAVGRLQKVVRGQQQEAAFRLRFHGKRKVDGHLVAVKVGVECGADQRMQADGLAFDQDRFEGLDAQTVQGRGAVQHHRMLLDHLFQHVEDFCLDTVHHLLRTLDVVRHAALDQLTHDKRLEQLDRHFLRQTALVDLQVGTDHDDASAGVVDTLAQQVLAEAALLTLQHVGEGLQGTVAGAGDRTASAAVVDQGVDGFLQHALLVAHDDLGRAELQQP